MSTVQSELQLAQPKKSSRKKHTKFSFDYHCENYSDCLLIHADCFEWLSLCPKESIQSVVTDPPYGVKEYDFDQIEKRNDGHGGIWRIPPAFDGSTRRPLPRFTALNEKERLRLHRFFVEWSKLIVKACVPGAHVLSLIHI